MTAPSAAGLLHVLSPIDIGNRTVPNRVVRTAHATGIARGTIDEDFIAYHEARARGGVGLTILEIASVHPSSMSGIFGWDDSVVPQYEALAGRLHAHGSLVFQQLWHGGHHTAQLDGSPPWSASDIPSVQLGVVPAPMTRGQIDEVVAGFAGAARRARDGGLDGVELHYAHGYLVGQFLSPLTNRRADEYGGPLENRLRFAQEVLLAVRAEVGPGFPVGVRLSSTEGVPGGLVHGDTADVARLLEATGALDFVDVTLGGYLSFPKMIGGSHEPHGYELADSARVTTELGVPTIVTGRILTLQEADDAIAAGQADLVSMVRATIADPELVRKTIAGRARQVRPCIGCNQGCVGGLFGPQMRVGCTVNPAAGQERVIQDVSVADVSLDVLVVGGGPAGMEAARTAALRGHRVVLAEAGEQLGGQLAYARVAPNQSDLGRFVDWLAGELIRLDVAVRCNVRVDRAFVAATGADLVVVATGSVPRGDGLQAARPGRQVTGVDRPHVCSSWDVLNGTARTGSRALVLDDLGHQEAICVADQLLSQGADVTVVTRFATIGTQLDAALMAEPARQRLLRAGARIVTHSELVSVDADCATIRSLDTGKAAHVDADTVVLVTANRPVNSLAGEVADLGCKVVVVGDARSPRYLQTAIREAHLALRSF